jgi:hypothetical protein
MHMSVHCERGPTGSQSQAVGAPMATIKAAVFWTTLALTPRIAVVAILLLRERTGPSDDEESDFRDLSSSQKLEFDDQPSYPQTQ